MRRSTTVLVTTAILGLCIPFTSNPAAQAADEAPAPTAYGGYQADVQATPVRIEVFEPTIPIPVDPGKSELELSLAFTRVHSQVGTQQSLGSWLWPGDSIGQGLATFGTQLGLPPELLAGGYPVQVNAAFPSDVTDQRQEPLPGLVMRAVSEAEESRSQAGFATDSEASEGAVPNASASNLFGLIRVAGASSTSRVTLGDKEVTTVARSALGDVALLGGLITLEGFTATARNTSNGTSSTSSATTDIGSISVMGQKIAFNNEGFVVPGQKIAIPGPPIQLTDLLAKLGVSLQLAQETHSTEGATASAEAKGLVVTLDVGALKKTLQLDPLIAVLRTLTGMLPEELAQLGSLVDTATHLSPKIVVRLGNASATTLTVPQMSSDSDEAGSSAADGATTGTPSVASNPPASGGGAAAVTALPTAPTSGIGEMPASTGLPTSAPGENDLVSATPGLPALNSVPGLIFWGALAIAALAGVWLRRIGLLVLNGGAACAHGCESGLPDLRAL